MLKTTKNIKEDIIRNFKHLCNDRKYENVTVKGDIVTAFDSIKKRDVAMTIIRVPPKQLSKHPDTLSFMKEYGDHITIIVARGLTSNEKSLYRHKNVNSYEKLIRDIGCNMIMDESELLIHLTDHVLVPKHIRLSDIERDEIMKAYMMTKEQCPKVYVNDPVARWFGLDIGEMCRIIRPSPVSGFSPYYRICIPPL